MSLDLLVVPGPLVREKQRVQIGPGTAWPNNSSLAGVLAALRVECGVATDEPLALALVVAGSERAAPIADIAELGAKAKVSLRLASDFAAVQLEVGTRVELCGLAGSLTEARLNGTPGKVVLWDAVAGVYVVELELQGKEVRYPAANVRALPDDEAEGDEEGGDTFEITLDKGGDGAVDDVLQSFEIKKTETMGSVKRRMSVSMGVSPEEMALLLGMGGGDEDDNKTVAQAGLTKRTKVSLPQCSGFARVQYKGKGKFEEVNVSLKDGLLSFMSKDVGGGARQAKVFGCEVSAPKSVRRGHAYCVRVDLGGPRVDSMGCNKYVISMNTKGELDQWVEDLVAYSRMNEMTAMKDDGLDEPEPAPAAAEDEDYEDEEGEEGDSFEVSLDVGLQQQKFQVKKGETMGSVKRRMSVSTGVSPEEMALLMGMGGGEAGEDLSFEDSMTVEEAGILKKGAKIRLPHHAANVQVQYKGKGKFEPVHLDLRDGKLTFIDIKTGNDLRECKVFGCTVTQPKGSRRGHPYCLRVDLGGPRHDNLGETKYVISLAGPVEAQGWYADLKAYHTLNEVTAKAAMSDDESHSPPPQQRPQQGISEGVPPQRSQAPPAFVQQQQQQEALAAAPAPAPSQAPAPAPPPAATAAGPTEAEQVAALRLETERMQAEIEAEEIRMQAMAATMAVPLTADKQKVFLLVMENECVPAKRKLDLEVEDFADLLTTVQKELALTQPIVLHRPVRMLGGQPIEMPVALKDLKELDDKTKVQVLLRSAYLQMFMAPAPAPAPPSPVPAAAAAAAVEPEAPAVPKPDAAPVRILLIMDSNLYPRKAKIKVLANDLEALYVDVQEELGLSVAIILAKFVVGDEKPEALTSLDQLEMKSKVQIYTKHTLAEARGEVPGAVDLEPELYMPSPREQSPSPEVPDYVGLMMERGDVITYSRRMRIDRVEEAVFESQEAAADSSGEDAPGSSDEEVEPVPEPEPAPEPVEEPEPEPTPELAAPEPAQAPAPEPVQRTKSVDSEEEFSDEEARMASPRPAAPAAEPAPAPAAEPVAESAPPEPAAPAAAAAAAPEAAAPKVKAKVRVKASGVRTKKPAAAAGAGAGGDAAAPKVKAKVKVSVKPKVKVKVAASQAPAAAAPPTAAPAAAAPTAAAPAAAEPAAAEGGDPGAL